MPFLDIYKKHGLYAEFDLERQELKLVEKEDNGPSEPYVGSLYRLGGKDILFFRENEFLLIGEIGNLVRIPHSAKAKISKCRVSLGLRRTLTIYSEMKNIYTLKYCQPIIFPPLWLDNTAFNEKEFHDPCLFICNVVNDARRYNLVFKN